MVAAGEAQGHHQPVDEVVHTLEATAGGARRRALEVIREEFPGMGVEVFGQRVEGLPAGQEACMQLEPCQSRAAVEGGLAVDQAFQVWRLVVVHEAGPGEELGQALYGLTDMGMVAVFVQ